VTRTALAQPLLFATEVATARLWASWGIRPDDQLGHSIGELAAAHISGVFTLEDAVRVVVERGRLMQGMAPGAMLAVSLTEKEALGFEDDDICVAAFNGPREQTLAGSISGIDRLEGQLRERGVQFTRLDTSHAFHHPSMREAAAGLLQILREIPLSAPSRSFVSCVTGLPITAEEVMRAEYWADSIVQPVRFSRAARTLLDTPAAVYIECGAGRGLGAMVRTQGLGEDDIVLTSMAGRGEGLSDADCALEALGKAWQAGGAVDWQGVWRHRQRRCVHLPGYPFERQRHWIDDIADTQQQVIASPASVAAPGNCFVRGWAAADAPTAGAASGSQNWIVLCDESGLGSELCKRLRQDGASVVAVHSSGAAVHQSDIEYAVDPTQPAAMTDLVARLAPNCRPVHVVNAWAAIVRPGPLGPERAAHGAALTFHAPIRLLRALRAANFSVNRFTTVSGGLFAIGAGDRPEPIAAPALGLVRVMPQEIAGLSARLVDMAPPADGPAAQVLLDQLVSELNSAASEPVVAYRGDKRLIETFQPLHLPPPSLERLIRPGGVYMITGGFGGIGGVLARLIAQVEGVRLVLVGRRGLAEKDVETVRALEGLGATVLPLAADTANLNAMAQVFAEVQMRFGRISGIIHAAGVPGGRMLMLPEVGDAGNVFAPKLQGAVNLMSLVAPHQPDFIMLCSSFASVGGGMGQGEYAAANAFLDAIAAYGQFLGLRTTAISWPAWREVGMAHAIEMPPELDHLREASLRSGISPDEGAELFARIIASGAPHVVVAPYPDRQPPAAATRPSAVVELTTAVSTPVMPQIAADADDRTLLLARLGAIWSDVLGSASIAAEDNFFEIGGQSLMALSIVIRVGEEFGIELKLSDVLENPQLVQFADLVHQRLCDAIAAMPDEVVCEALAQEVLS
jgi:acyl transferase domain-containing protein